MAVFATQWALSLELTRLCPQLLEVGGTVLKTVARKISASGSDVLVEDGLAEIFGRNKLDALFESSFKTSIKDKTERLLPGLVDIILEGGAGPTVERSLRHSEYLSSLAQLSLLTFVHDPEPLTRLLRSSLGERARGSPEQVPPQYDQLHGALEAIQEQTIAYRWDLVLRDIEDRIYITSEEMAKAPPRRSLPVAICQGLLDCLTAVQRMPEHKVVSIRTHTGTMTIVAWAHKLLGLTVSVSIVDSKGERRHIKFGEGLDQVVIEDSDRSTGAWEDKISLLCDDDIEFSITRESESTESWKGNQPQPVRAYATTVLRNAGIIDSSLRTELAQLVLAVSLAVTRRHRNRITATGQLPKSGHHFANLARVADVVKVLFDGTELSAHQAEALSETAAALSVSWTIEALPPSLVLALKSVSFDGLDCNWYGVEYDPGIDGLESVPEAKEFTPAPGTFLQRIVFSLCRLTLALSTIANFKDCHELILSLKGCDIPYVKKPQVAPLSGAEAWNLLITFLYGNEPCNRYQRTRSSVVSCRGWSLVLEIVNNVSSPGDTLPDIYAFPGVPTRNHERRRLVIDALDQSVTPSGGPERHLYHVAASSGECSRLSNRLAAQFRSSQLGVCEKDCIEVVQQIVLEARETISMEATVVRAGMRGMQELCWNSVRLPPCLHIAEPNASVELPDRCIAFTGYIAPKTKASKPWHGNNALHISTTVGHKMAQWTVFLCSQSWIWDQWEGGDHEVVTYIRSSGCCLKCAVGRASKDRPGHPKILIA